jgi:hypothetical protein
VGRYPRRAPIFDTYLELDETADWLPLEAVGRLSRSSDELAAIDEDDFMYMAAVVGRPSGPRIHLYKHIETRHYLNLDDAGHAYEYLGTCFEDDADDQTRSGGTYRLHRSLKAALLAVLTCGLPDRYIPRPRSCIY